MSTYRSNLPKTQWANIFKFIILICLGIALCIFLAMQVYIFFNRTTIEKHFSKSENFGILTILEQKTTKSNYASFISVAVFSRSSESKSVKSVKSVYTFCNSALQCRNCALANSLS